MIMVTFLVAGLPPIRDVHESCLKALIQTLVLATVGTAVAPVQSRPSHGLSTIETKVRACPSDFDGIVESVVVGNVPAYAVHSECLVPMLLYASPDLSLLLCRLHVPTQRAR